MSKPDGGPAFPQSCTDTGHNANVFPGMSLRDWFAGQALVGLLAKQRAYTDTNLGDQAYAAADAMLRERDR